MHASTRVIYDRFNNSHEIAKFDDDEGFRKQLINLMYKDNKPDQFRHTLIAYWLDPVKTCSSTTITIDSTSTINFDKIYKALNPTTGKPVYIAFIGVYTVRDIKRRFGSRANQIRSHQLTHDTPINELRYCLVSQRQDGQYFLLT